MKVYMQDDRKTQLFRFERAWRVVSKRISREGSEGNCWYVTWCQKAMLSVILMAI